jgi:hypothetical protein
MFEGLFTHILRGLDAGEPRVHDYVIGSSELWSSEQNEFFLSHIGRIRSISYVNGKPLYSVDYDEIFDSPNYKYDSDRTVFWRKEIKHWAENKNDLLEFVDYYGDVFKYNL